MHSLYLLSFLVFLSVPWTMARPADTDPDSAAPNLMNRAMSQASGAEATDGSVTAPSAYASITYNHTTGLYFLCANGGNDVVIRKIGEPQPGCTFSFTSNNDGMTFQQAKLFLTHDKEKLTLAAGENSKWQQQNPELTGNTPRFNNVSPIASIGGLSPKEEGNGLLYLSAPDTSEEKKESDSPAVLGSQSAGWTILIWGDQDYQFK
ncbi:hypothetical protein BJ684DRAFT_15599 [Piptocephalis cylindrospora]|uniref:Uncharacterized protein n=1 Tax=Piptocephalis cylindrospora TaxID=1907219 RepID=A0A4P9Y5P9_9FUNG|nr:hypothetical protein BJ684DRAFT_15599 [Piptocephalis cylindrospora]|eukprot:RKP14052.1 hypothetical protein BJ684DRAFT_15599 [Piptocephalis cylindrospora]